MSSAICLLVYSLGVLVLAPPVLSGSTGSGRNPRLGLIAWTSAIGSVLVSWVAAAAFVIVDIGRDLLSDEHLSLSRCFTQLHDAAIGVHGAVVQVGLLVLIGFGVVAVGVLASRLGTALARARSATHSHANAARIIGRPHARHDAVVIDHPEPAAYSVAGNPDTIVLTQGIVAALDDEHLEAVMAHERAHLTGRHYVLLAVTRALAAVLPRIDLFVTGAAQVARLVELSADDAAASLHGPKIVREALLALAGTRTPSVFGAPEVGLADRVFRLSAPYPAARSMSVTVSALTTAAFFAGPMLAIFAAAAGLGVCTL